MSLQSIRHRLDLIDSVLSPSRSEDLSRTIRGLIQSSPNRDWLSDAYIEISVLNSIYALVRHLPWHETPIFQELLSEYLRTELNMPAETANQIYFQASKSLSDVRPKLFTEMEVDADRHFLRYLFIASAVAKDEQQLTSDLGLGSGVLRRIKMAATWIVTQSSRQSEEGKKEFIPALEVCFAETMLDLTREMRKTPWIVDIHRLKYRLLEAREPARSQIETLGTNSVFEILLFLSEGHSTKSRFELADFEKALEVTGVEGISAAGLIQLFESMHLISNTFERGFKPRYGLTPLGEELTAEVFAHTDSRPSSMEFAEMTRLPLRYQAAMVKNLPGSRMAELRSYLASLKDKAFSPPAVEQAVRRLAIAIGPQDIATLCGVIIESSTSAFYQKAIIAGLNEAMEQKPVRQFVQNVAESNLSALAIEEARLLLVRTTVVDGPSDSAPSSAELGEVNPTINS